MVRLQKQIESGISHYSHISTPCEWPAVHKHDHNNFYADESKFTSLIIGQLF